MAKKFFTCFYLFRKVGIYERKLIEGKGKYSGKGIAVTEVFKMAESFKPHIKEGFDFLKEFKAAILK